MRRDKDRIREALEARRKAAVYRSVMITGSPQMPVRHFQGKEVLSFSGNDYLGLANHPQLVEAFQQTAGRYGVGSGAAHLLGGHTEEHEALECELAKFTHRDSAVLFSTGYMANLGVIQALLGRGDKLFQDRLNHASLIDAGVLSRATSIRYRHNDLAHLRRKMDEAGERNSLIASDGVFSMDGDVADVQGLANIASAHNAWLLIDDAHGLGVLGQDGGGVLQESGLSQSQVPLLMGTLGKAFGVFGAFVAGERDVIDYIRQQARPWVYTTAPPAAMAAAARISLRLVSNEVWRREHLVELIRLFRDGATAAGLEIGDTRTPIQTLMLGTNERALKVSQRLWDRGIYVAAIRTPTVPEGSARLRITFSAAHQPADVEKLLQELLRIAG